jgi:hypothetical protein
MTHAAATRRASRAAAVVIGMLAIGTASASAEWAKTALIAAGAACTAPTLTQPFTSAGDTNSYAPLPGESWNVFTGTGWTLSGGAKVVSATLADGTTGTVLDLPSGARAVSPATCLTNDHPSARGQIRSVSGTGGVAVTVTSLGTKQQSAGFMPSTSSAWTLASPVNLNPSTVSGWQLAQFTFTTPGTGEYQISNFYVDPKMRH